MTDMMMKKIHKAMILLALVFTAAAGEAKSAELPDYKVGARMRFLLNDTLAVLKLFLARRWREAAAGLADVFRAREALWDRDDPKPFWRYLKSTILGK